jgi:hypothetical protein
LLYSFFVKRLAGGLGGHRVAQVVDEVPGIFDSQDEAALLTERPVFLG